MHAGSPRKDSHRSSTSEYDALKASGGTVCCKQAAADVGSTAAAALAAAMSSSWQRTASDKNGASCVRAGADGGGAAADAGAGLPCRAGFEIAVQIGGQEPHNHLSDPSVREHVRRLTSTMQVRDARPLHVLCSAAQKKGCPFDTTGVTQPNTHARTQASAPAGRNNQRRQRPAAHRVSDAPRVHLWRAPHPRNSAAVSALRRLALR